MRRCGWWLGAIVGAAAAPSAVPSAAVAQATAASAGVPRPPYAYDPAPAVDAGVATFVPPVTVPFPAALTGPPAEGPGVPRLFATGNDAATIYAPPEPTPLADKTNDGGVNVDLNFRYLTDDVYRGVSHNRAVFAPGVNGQASEGNLHASNFQADAKVEFDLGKLPHPYVGVFANLNDSDPLSRFQEIRPYVGFEYALRPLLFDVGLNTYIYPERERLSPSPNTSEVFLRLTLDDTYFTRSRTALLSPYLYTAYDYQLNNGFYFELGLKHDFEFADLGFTLTPYADVAYVSHFARQFVTVSPQDSGFQHYDVGLRGSYSLNHLFKLAPRYGQFSIEGYLNYTGKFSNPVLANDEVWGGVGQKYRY